MHYLFCNISEEALGNPTRTKSSFLIKEMFAKIAQAITLYGGSVTKNHLRLILFFYLFRKQQEIRVFNLPNLCPFDVA